MDAEETKRWKAKQLRYKKPITIAKFDFIEAEDESWLVDDLRKLEVEDEDN